MGSLDRLRRPTYILKGEGKLWDELSTARFLHLVRLLLRVRLLLKGAGISSLTIAVVPRGHCRIIYVFYS